MKLVGIGKGPSKFDGPLLVFCVLPVSRTKRISTRKISSLEISGRLFQMNKDSLSKRML